MPVVSNTSPILNLAIIGQLNLLRQQFNTIWIPGAVQDELRLDEELPGSSAIRQAIEEGWLLVKPVENAAFAQVLMRELDRGESEAIALAIERDASRILLDEREARRVAKGLNLSVTGVPGILLRAQEPQHLPVSIAAAIDALQEKAGFRLAESLVEAVLRESEQPK
jgi:uncharacterized protein